MRKINPELWLLLVLVLIAAMLNFLVASQKMVMVFYFLPTLFSAYYFGRRHATLTALASVALVVLVANINPTLFTRHVDLHFARRFDLAIWGGVLMVAGYSTGTLYERSQKTLREMEDGYEGMLAILQNFLANQKYSNTHAYRLSMCATRIAEGVGLDAESIEDIRMAALLFNLKDLGITNEVLCKAAQESHEDLQYAIRNGAKARSRTCAMNGSLQQAIPIFLAERQLRQNGCKPEDASLEIRILVLAEEYDALTSGQSGAKMSPSQAGREVIKRAGTRYDSLVLDGFTKAFEGQAAGAGA